MEDLTDDMEVIKTLHEVYGDDVEQLDLLVGMSAEKKIKGFAISETAFFIFLIMASRFVLELKKRSNYHLCITILCLCRLTNIES